MPLKTDRRFLGRFAVFFLYAGVIIWLSLTSHPPKAPVKWLAWDKLQHASAYFLFTFFAGRAILALPVSFRNAWRIALGFAVSFGLFMELAQSYLTRIRTADKFDLLANTVGALSLYLLILLFPGLAGKSFHPKNRAPRVSPDKEIHS